MKTGSKYYGFKNWDENRVKRFREKEPENLGMKTWTPPLHVKSFKVIIEFLFLKEFWCDQIEV